MASNVVYNESTGTYVAKGSSDDTGNSSTSTNENFGKTAEEIKADKVKAFRESTNRPDYVSKDGETAAELKSRINKDIAKRKQEEKQKQADEYLVKFEEGQFKGKQIKASEKFVNKLKQINNQNNNFNEPQKTIKNKPIIEQKIKSEPTAYENRIQQLKKRESNLENFKTSVYNKFNIAPNEDGNFFLETGKALLRAPLEIASIPTFFGGRVSLAIDSLFDSKKSRQELVSGLKETPAAVIKTLDPTTPEGLVNDVLIFGGIGAKIFTNVKSSVKPSIVEGKITNFNDITKITREGTVAGNKISQKSISVKKNNIIETKRTTNIGSGKKEIILKENNIAGKDFSVTREVIFNSKNKKISEEFVKPKDNLKITEEIKTKKLFESKDITKDKQSGEIIKLEKQNVETLGQSKQVDEGVFYSKISKENYGSSFNRDILTGQNIKLKEGNIQTIRLSKDKNNFIEESELIKAEKIKGELSFDKNVKNNKISYKKSETNTFLEVDKVTEKVDITRKINPTLEVETLKTTKGIGQDFYYRNIKFKSEAKLPFDNKKGSLSSQNEVLTVKPTETQKVKFVDSKIKDSEFKTSFSDTNIRSAINKRDLLDINSKKIINSDINTDKITSDTKINTINDIKTTDLIDNKIIDKFKVEKIDAIKTDSKISTIPDIDTKTKDKTTSITEQKIDTEIVQKPINDIVTKQKPKIIEDKFINDPFKPKEEKFKINPAYLNTLNTKKVSKSNFTGFNVLVKKQGKFQLINKKLLSKSSALNLGYGEVDRTSSASFKIVAAQGKISNRDFKPASILKSKFYNKGNLYIEKNKYRIDTVGEKKGITFKSKKKKTRFL